MNRPICPACNQRPRAINCYKDDRVYYRSRCDTCTRKNKKIKPALARWQSAGYKKKIVCDRCTFKARYSAQLLVFHVDGNLHNTTARNLKTICQNCAVDIVKSDLPWRPGDLEVDH